MKVIFSATNPCHMFEMARAVNAEVAYYSGYPVSKLGDTGKLKVNAYPWRTILTYGLLKLPDGFRPIRANTLFRWQDWGFDRTVAGSLPEADWVVGLAGQCLHTFKRARQMGMKTVLSHAMGPSQCFRDLVQPEHERLGIPMDYFNLKSDYIQQEEEEWALADFHWVASSTVADQLISCGISSKQIWIVPYGADRNIFYPDENRKDSSGRICFAGQMCVRKGIPFLLEVLQQEGQVNWVLDCYGDDMQEVERAWNEYNGLISIHRHGSVSKAALGAAFRESDVLVLPSWEEGFGLVVVQALQSGLPCIVSDRVGAKDLIKHRENGSVVPCGDPVALRQELEWWLNARKRLNENHGWEAPAEMLGEKMKDASL